MVQIVPYNDSFGRKWPFQARISRGFRNQIRNRMFLIVEFLLIHLRYKNGLSSMRKHEQIIEHTCLRLMFLDDNSRISKAISKIYCRKASKSKLPVGYQSLTGITWSEWTAHIRFEYLLKPEIVHFMHEITPSSYQTTKFNS